MILGYVCLAVLLLLVIKMFVRMSKNKKMNRVFGKIHKPLGIALLVLGTVHAIITIPVWNTRAGNVMISGFAVLFLCTVTAVTYLMRKKNLKIWMRYHRISVLLLVLALAGHMAVYFIDFANYQKQIQTITIDGMSAEGIADGTYYGEYDAGYIKASVKVTVADEKMEITLLRHENERGKKAERLIGDMMNQQTTKVDEVSGATNSSHVIMKAVENALVKGKEQKK